MGECETGIVPVNELQTLQELLVIDMELSILWCWVDHYDLKIVAYIRLSDGLL